MPGRFRLCCVVLLYLANGHTGIPPAQSQETVIMPKVSIAGEHPLAELLQRRRSVRAYRAVSLSLAELARLLWAAQGINHPEGLRTAPSAGALYPLEIYVAAGDVDGLEPAVYRYRAADHALDQVIDGDVRRTLARAALNQAWLASAAVVVVITVVYERTTRKYGERGKRYVDIEVGHAAQNLYLQAEALRLGTAAVGAFDDGKIARALNLPANTKPLLLMPVGKRREDSQGVPAKK